MSPGSQEERQDKVFVAMGMADAKVPRHGGSKVGSWWVHGGSKELKDVYAAGALGARERVILGMACLCPPNSFVEALSPKGMLLGGGAFGRRLGFNEVMRLRPSRWERGSGDSAHQWLPCSAVRGQGSSPRRPLRPLCAL